MPQMSAELGPEDRDEEGVVTQKGALAGMTAKERERAMDALFAFQYGTTKEESDGGFEELQELSKDNPNIITNE